MLPAAALVFLLTAWAILISRRANRREPATNQFDELHLKIREDIRFAVEPKFLEVSLAVNDLVDLAIDIWRTEQRLLKCLPSLPENHRKGLEVSIEKLKRYITKYDIDILDYTNQKYNDGLNLDILSVEKDPALPDPIIKETIEPTIMCKGKVVRKAKIILLSNQ